MKDKKADRQKLEREDEELLWDREAFLAMVGARIREVREEKGMTQQELAFTIDVSPKYLYEMERGSKAFSIIFLYRIAKALQVNCDVIMGGKENQVIEEPDIYEEINLFSESQTKNILRVMRETDI